MARTAKGRAFGLATSRPNTLGTYVSHRLCGNARESREGGLSTLTTVAGRTKRCSTRAEGLPDPTVTTHPVATGTFRETKSVNLSRQRVQGPSVSLFYRTIFCGTVRSLEGRDRVGRRDLVSGRGWDRSPVGHPRHPEGLHRHPRYS